MNIDTWLQGATDLLQRAGIPSAHLDARLMLCHVTGRDRTYLHAYGDTQLSEVQLQQANAHLKQRQQRIPLAYITGHKEFYGRDFMVSPAVLIPRPETETLIGTMLGLMLPAEARIADIGTGSGAIAITLKLSQPRWQIYATDISHEALTIARQNAEQLGADIIFLQGDLAVPLKGVYDAVIANLPYVDRTWERSPETDFEPAQTLFAENHGLEQIHKLIRQAVGHLTAHGYLILEADPEQHTAIISTASSQGYTHTKTRDYCICLQKS